MEGSSLEEGRARTRAIPGSSKEEAARKSPLLWGNLLRSRSYRTTAIVSAPDLLYPVGFPSRRSMGPQEGQAP
jgi:hypothetical protein